MSRLSVINLQRQRALDTDFLRKITTSLIETTLGLTEFDLSICLVGVKESARLNEQFLGHSGPTDVITFDYVDQNAGHSCQERGSPHLGAPASRRLHLRGQPHSPQPGSPHLGAPASRRLHPQGQRHSQQPRTSATLHGDLFICVAVAEIQAAKFGTTWMDEVTRYVVHGVLHLLGHGDLEPDERRLMKKEENRLLRLLRRRFALSGLSRRRRMRA